ncbi:MAG: glutamate-5-semialdehyde dehydrogenase [Elusimicrobia bacterium]|jgi:glutamate-5-semialdehyde dehydrogenase|nr:glutamate-5-semialdehyde dehydrogenase [Elusimicrobiota bacterium]MBK7206819.1 glutamate-5-semialdehyde dehydrogenase [Elusimicrobiota bacterium]MBK7545617.1 glutamate-5-semialdehyde dehydrogenase [Elusimicrobiota bacterium]MBK7575193.1 glutamate-5-semialdehyde dehydrogenase [Elusimicrobiota bacterium]MBK7687834.1 glutamate-5-semialdehyde dehydrogenase [Elusimicrobiota bacterium]
MKSKAKKTTKNQRRVQMEAPPAYTARLVALCAGAKEASRALAVSPPEARDRALRTLAEALEKNQDDILFKNEIDLEAGRRAGLSASLLDRLALTPRRVADMAAGLRDIAALPDPLGSVAGEWERPNGLKVQKVRVPLGVVAMIYEARPNVTVDATGLCLKSGNAVVLRGGKEALESNTALVRVLKEALVPTGLPADCVQFVETSDRSVIRDLVRMDRFVDLVIPRGGEEMVNAIREMATVPVLSHGKGLCAVYVDQEADLAMAEKIALNAKIQRPGVCNAMETLLVHGAVADRFVPAMVRRFAENNVTVHGDAGVQKRGGAAVVPATPDDFNTEYLDLHVAMKVVDSLDAAIDHINTHGSHHSDAIVTRDEDAARRFLARVDSAAVLHNASTRLHDGGALGLGSEMGISTQKIHARGTMGVPELTTTKYVVRGSGQIRE